MFRRLRCGSLWLCTGVNAACVVTDFMSCGGTHLPSTPTEALLQDLLAQGAAWAVSTFAALTALGWVPFAGGATIHPLTFVCAWKVAVGEGRPPSQLAYCWTTFGSADADELPAVAFTG